MSTKMTAGLAALSMIVSAEAASAAPPVAMTDSGAVRGTLVSGVKSWKGIPFAETTAGANRWRPPQPIAKWPGIRDATAYGHDCMQLPFASDAAPLGTTPSEDCLVMNVWTPASAAKGAKLPVIAWIYGGGFVNGGSSPPTYSGENMAGKGVVFVSFNYRLGRFGTFLTPQLIAEQRAEPAVGNFGYMDQLAALKWIKRNVAAFGGDPNNVTIIGESAGGMSVNTLLTSPMAQGLFQRAVVMSGGSGQTAPDSRAQVEKASLAFAKAKGVAADDPQGLAKLRALSPEAVVDGTNLATFMNPGPGVPPFAGPFADGSLAVDPAAAIKNGKFAHVPVMIGATSDDIGGPTGYMVAGAHDLAGGISAARVPTYEYRFSYVASSIGKPGAQHASDIPFFFDTEGVKYGAATTDRDRAMGRIISAYIVNFAKTGDPNGPSLPRWSLYSRAEDRIMNFAEDGTAVPGKDPLSGKLPVILSGAAIDQNGTDVMAAKAWLALTDSSSWDQSWSTAGTIFKSQLTAPSWAASSEKVRVPLGAVTSRVLTNLTKVNSLPGVPDGEYELLAFRTSFANKRDATETVVLAHEVSGWKVDGYFIR